MRALPLTTSRSVHFKLQGKRRAFFSADTAHRRDHERVGNDTARTRRNSARMERILYCVESHTRKIHFTKILDTSMIRCHPALATKRFHLAD